MTDTTQLDETPHLAQAVISLTEQVGNPGGFTIGLSLASFSDGENNRIPVVDIVALAVMTILRELPADFKAALDKINTGVAELTEQLSSGADADEAIAKFQTLTGVAGFAR